MTESPGTPEWEELGIPEDNEAEPLDAGHGEEETNDSGQ